MKKLGRKGSSAIISGIGGACVLVAGEAGQSWEAQDFPIRLTSVFETNNNEGFISP